MSRGKFVYRLYIQYRSNQLARQPVEHPSQDPEPQPRRPVRIEHRNRFTACVYTIEEFLYGLFASLLPHWEPRIVPAATNSEQEELSEGTHDGSDAEEHE